MVEQLMTIGQQYTGGGGDALGMIVPIIALLILVVVFAGFWKVFTKAGQPG